MSFLSYPEGTGAGTANNGFFRQLISHLINHAGIQWSVELKGVVQRAVAADDLCTGYPHLNRDVVMAGMLLFPLIREGYLSGGLQGAMGVLGGMEVEERFKILQVLVSAQTDFARGEAKIVRYFYH
ncbi:MAG: hypothetical protein M1119_03870 [Firmicutes bacterium]|nr:hypothetical protein [Bacillota bacterium]